MTNPKPPPSSLVDEQAVIGNGATIWARKGKDSGTWKTTLRFDRFIQRFYDCDQQYEAPFGD